MPTALFYYHLGLHYSQTAHFLTEKAVVFYYHLGLHYSQTAQQLYTAFCGAQRQPVR